VHVEKIIAEAALPQECARTQMNLGTAYQNRVQGNKSENIELAIDCYESALKIYTETVFPLEWARIQANLGTAYQNRVQGNKSENIKLAIDCYKSALKIYTETAFLQECLDTTKDLGNLYFIQTNWHSSINAYNIAINVLENLRGKASEDRKQSILNDAIQIYENLIQASLNNHQLELAFTTVERIRSKRLVELIAIPDRYIPKEVRVLLYKYDTLQRQIDQLHTKCNSNNNSETKSAARSLRTSSDIEQFTLEVNALELQKTQVRADLAKLDPVAAGQKKVTPIPLHHIQALLTTPRSALLSIYTTKNDTHIFILRHNSTPQCFTCPGEGYSDLQTWLRANWLNQYSQTDTHTTWRNSIPDLLTTVSQRLQLDTQYGSDNS
jgi:Soluble NSF attachment protein, SNAP/Tetratricopeptide repeat